MSLGRAYGPSMPRSSKAEVLRAGIGAGLGLTVAAAILWALSNSTQPVLAQPLLIAPFGASAFLIFAVPNSPLAQPWSVLVGNSLSALAALGVLHFGLPALVTAPLAVTLAIFAMAVGRAMHPPGGAVALYVALAAPDSWGFVLSPVLVGSAALVITGVAWNRVTGRSYPFRQPAPSAHGTTDLAPERRHLPLPGALAELLSRLRLETNIGVEDLTRLITAAEAEAATRPLAGLTAAHLMSKDLISVSPDASATEIAAVFRARGFKSLPVVQQGQYLGMINEAALIGLGEPRRTAADLMTVADAVPQTEAAGLLVQRLADGRAQAIPVIDGPKLVGLVTRSDLIALLARSNLAPEKGKAL